MVRFRAERLPAMPEAFYAPDIVIDRALGDHVGIIAVHNALIAIFQFTPVEDVIQTRKSNLAYGIGAEQASRPNRYGALVRLIRLRRQMKEAVENEEYEMASELRDKIRQLEDALQTDRNSER